MADRIGLRQLRAFHAVMVSGSITAAAERLNLTQPAISKQLLALEQALDLRLFHRRSGRASTPTQEGIDYYKAIETTIAGLEELTQAANTVRGRKRIRIAATPPLINSAPLMASINRFLDTHPDTLFSLEPRHRLEIEDWVAARQIDVALALLPAAHPDLIATPLVETQAVVVLRPNHPLAHLDTVSWNSLEADRIIFPSRQPLRLRIDAQLKQQQQQQQQQQTRLAPLESSSAITCCRMAAAGLGVAVCDPFSPTAFSSSELLTKRLEPSVRLTYGALVSRSVQTDAVVAELCGLLGAEFGKFGIETSD